MSPFFPPEICAFLIICSCFEPPGLSIGESDASSASRSEKPFFLKYSRTLLLEIFLFFPANLPPKSSEPRKPFALQAPASRLGATDPFPSMDSRLRPPPAITAFPALERTETSLGASLVCVTPPLPICSPSDSLPPAQEPRTPNPLALRSAAGPATRRLPLTLDGWEGEAASGAGPLREH